MVVDIVLLVVLPTFVAVVAAIVLGRRRGARDGDSDSDSVSFVGGVIGALFTVVLAFYVVFAWQLGSDIDTDATTESNALVDAWYQADRMPEPVRTEARQLIQGYADGVIEREWPELATGTPDSAVSASDATLRSLRTAFDGLPADDDAMLSTRDGALADLREIDESHRSRVDRSTDTDVFNTVLLVGTLVGAALMVAFPLVVGLSARPANVAAVGILTFVVAATVYISLQLAHPLSGPFAVEPDPFSDAVAVMGPSPDVQTAPTPGVFP